MSSSKTLSSSLGAIIAFVFYIALRETTPFIDSELNAITLMCQCCVFVWLLSLQLHANLSQRLQPIWGALLVVFVLAIILRCAWSAFKFTRSLQRDTPRHNSLGSARVSWRNPTVDPKPSEHDADPGQSLDAAARSVVIRNESNGFQSKNPLNDTVAI